MNTLSVIKNIGPKTVQMLHDIDIFSLEDLLQADYREIKKRLIARGIRPHLNMFYAIEMGLQNRTWHSITEQEKREIQHILGMAE
ncbi:hypothetical protein LBMAG25_13210 [Bacteroidota bacterium]|nr:hypothetical protein LBMAG25_13210 [Bacteroidota bacterium]